VMGEPVSTVEIEVDDDVGTITIRDDRLMIIQRVEMDEMVEMLTHEVELCS